MAEQRKEDHPQKHKLDRPVIQVKRNQIPDRAVCCIFWSSKDNKKDSDSSAYLVSSPHWSAATHQFSSQLNRLWKSCICLFNCLRYFAVSPEFLHNSTGKVNLIYPGTFNEVCQACEERPGYTFQITSWPQTAVRRVQCSTGRTRVNTLMKH